MSQHPNALIMVHFTPDNLSRKTYREILQELKITDSDDALELFGFSFSHQLMEEEYDQDFQISAQEGDIVFHSCITYGYGEKIEFEKIIELGRNLEKWAHEICKRHHCTSKIYLGANYW